MEPIEAAGFAYKSHMLPFYIAKLFVSNSELYWVKFSLIIWVCNKDLLPLVPVVTC